MSWQYMAVRFNGDGTQTRLHPDLPLSDVRIIDDLSGPGGLIATITPEVRGLAADTGSAGDMVFVRWSTVILAIKDGLIRGGGFLDSMTEAGPKLVLNCIGPAGYPKGMPYTGDRQWIGVDPLAIVRHIWAHLQGEPGGDLGAVIETNNSPVRIGTPERDVNFTTGNGESVEFVSGPYKLAYWQTHDLGREIDSLAKETPFQYRTSWEWVGEKAVPTIEYAYPGLGRRLKERFVVGENVLELPPLTWPSDSYATEVWVLGAGSGRETRKGSDALSKRRGLRRVAILEDKSITSNAKARSLAIAELKMMSGAAEITDLTVKSHSMAPLGSYNAGDEILVTTADGWSGSMDMWCKIISMDIDPVTESVDIQVVPVEKLG